MSNRTVSSRSPESSSSLKKVSDFLLLALKSLESLSDRVKAFVSVLIGGLPLLRWSFALSLKLLTSSGHFLLVFLSKPTRLLLTWAVEAMTSLFWKGEKKKTYTIPFRIFKNSTPTTCVNSLDSLKIWSALATKEGQQQQKMGFQLANLIGETF